MLHAGPDYSLITKPDIFGIRGVCLIPVEEICNRDVVLQLVLRIWVLRSVNVTSVTVHNVPLHALRAFNLPDNA